MCLVDVSYLPFLKICIGANLDEGGNKSLTFTRRYLDPNRVSYEVIFFFFSSCKSQEMI